MSVVLALLFAVVATLEVVRVTGLHEGTVTAGGWFMSGPFEFVVELLAEVMLQLVATVGVVFTLLLAMLVVVVVKPLLLLLVAEDTVTATGRHGSFDRFFSGTDSKLASLGLLLSFSKTEKNNWSGAFLLHV